MVTCTTSSQCFDSYRLAKGVHEIVQKTPQTEWQDCLLPLPPLTLILRVKGSTKVFFHVATFSSLQDALPQTLPSFSLPHPCPHTGDVIDKVRWKNIKDTLKTKKAPGSLNCHRWAACSSFRKFPSSAFLHRRNSLLSWPVKPGETKQRATVSKRENPKPWELKCFCHPTPQSLQLLISSMGLYLAQLFNALRGWTLTHIPPCLWVSVTTRKRPLLSRQS